MRYVPIAITPRSGSTVFCSCLESIGLSGQIGEVLNPRGPRAWFQERLGEVAVVDLVRATAQLSPDGKLAIFKTSALDFRAAIAEDSEILSLLKGPFLFIDREDKIAQGISLYRAKASGFWHQPRGGEQVKKACETPAYAFNAIYREVEFCKKEAAFWNDFFSRNGLSVVRVLYEDFVEEPEKTVLRALKELEIEFDMDAGIIQGFNKLSDPVITARWRSKFISDLKEAKIFKKGICDEWIL
jgi:LPS sulfotransferase NodH